MKNLETTKKGFTLVELLVVMAILGILVLIAAPRFAEVTDSAKLATMESNHGTLKSIAKIYLAENRGNPATQWSDIERFIDGNDGNGNAGDMDGKPAGTTYKIDTADNTTGGPNAIFSELTLSDGTTKRTIEYNLQTGDEHKNY